jgi:hypothetical protein
MPGEKLTQTQLENKLEKLTTEIWKLAENSQEDSLLLVTILRKLELSHRQIREQMFEPSLPDTRHHLYLLLRNIEESGGWPYIERMRLQNICEKFLVTGEQEREQVKAKEP